MTGGRRRSERRREDGRDGGDGTSEKSEARAMNGFESAVMSNELVVAGLTIVCLQLHARNSVKECIIEAECSKEVDIVEDLSD